MPLLSFLGRKLSTGQTIVKNTFLLSLAQGLTGLVNFFVVILLMRCFGADGYGRFAYALSIVSLFSTLFDFGFSMAVTREFARDRRRERYLGDIIVVKSLLGLAASLIILGVSWLIIAEPAVRQMTCVLAVYIFSTELLNLFYAFFRARENMEYEAAFRILNVVLLAGMLLGVVYAFPSLMNLAFAYVAANLATLVAAAIAVAFKGRGERVFRPTLDLSVWREFLLIGWYLALSRGVGDVTMYTDSVMLGCWGQMAETGYYNAISKIVRLILFPMGLITTAIFPALVRARSRSNADFLALWHKWTRVTVFFAVMPATIVFLYAREIVHLFFADSAAAAGALRILVFMASITYMHNLLYHGLLVFDRQRDTFFALLTGCLANVALNAALIPRFSLYGASAATVITHLIILVQYCRYAVRSTAIRPFDFQLLNALGISIISSISVFLLSLALKQLGPGLGISVACAAVTFTAVFIILERVARQLGVAVAGASGATVQTPVESNLT